MLPPASVRNRRARLLSSVTPILLSLGLSVSLGAGLLTATPAADPALTPATTQPEIQLAAAALPSAPYTTFTLNIRHDMGKKKARADMVRAFTLGDVGGLQEMSELADRQMLIELCKENDWGWYMPNDGGVAIPIIFDRARFRLITGRTVQTHGPEPKVTPGRYINTVRLREVATGKVFGFINTHTIAQASYDAQASNMRRIPRLRKHLRMLRNEIKSLFTTTEHVFAAGDLNVNYLADRRRKVAGLPTRRLGNLVNFDMPLEGSRGPTSLLDYGMTVKHDSGLVLEHSEIVRGFNSDHDAVVFTYRPVDLFADGPLFNAPLGGPADQHRVLNRVARAIQDAEVGAEVRLATSRIDDAGLTAALLGAHDEGIPVQVILGGGRATDDEQKLEAVLGSDTTTGSWVMRCSGSCQGGDGGQELNALLVSRAGGTTDLTLIGSGPFTDETADQFSDVMISTDGDVYAGYRGVFERMAGSTTNTEEPASRGVAFGPLRAQLYPVAAGSRDPMLRALRPVKCRKARGLHTDDRRTNVRVSARAWSGERGLAIARRLAGLKSNGCDVVVAIGSQVKKGVRKTLRKAGIPVRRTASGQQVLVVDGHYGSARGAQRVWTGGPTWTDRGIASDGVAVELPWASAAQSYLSSFSRVWRS